jgi:hydrogenase-4 membrane subunit HyfE
MAQFDSLIILPLLFSLLLTLILYYSVFVQITIPNFFEVKKFRKKNLKTSSFYTFFNTNTPLNSKNSYKQAVSY